MAAAAAVGQGIGTALNFWGSQINAQEAEYAGAVRARENRINAERAIAESRDEARLVRQSGELHKGSIRASYGASGVDSTSGSAMDILRNSAAAIEMDAQNILETGRLKAAAYLRGAEYEQRSGELRAKSHRISAWGTLLGGGAKTYAML